MPHACDDSCINLSGDCKRNHMPLGGTSPFDAPVPDVCRGPVPHMTGTPGGFHPSKGKPGRPKGSSNLKSKQPSAIARKFLECGLDWRVDFAEAIKSNKRERIKLWLRLLPYLITTGSRAKVRTWKGKASKAALIALEAMEQSNNG